ncbi:MAG: recombinase family protein [Armatimonadota bacterium]
MNPDLKNLPADIILRKSRSNDESLDEVFHIHKPRLIALAEEYGLNYTIYEDIVSGEKSTAANAIMGRVLQRAESGQTKVWVVMDIDRLARPSWEELGSIMGCVEKHGIYILTPGALYKPDDIAHSLFSGFRFLMARAEIKKYKERVAVARDHITRMESRYSNGRAPYGYTNVKGERRCEPDPLTYPIVQYAWSLIRTYGVRNTYMKCQEKFGPLGVSVDAFFAMFRNPFFCGYPCKRFNADGSSRGSQSDWIWPEKQGDYPVPVTLDDWQQIQSIIDQRMLQRVKTSADTWARGILRFAACGSKAVGISINYGCNEGRFILAKHNIRKNRVHAVIELLLEHLFADPQITTALVNAGISAISERNTNRSELLQQIEAVRKAISEKDTQLKKLMAAFSKDLSDDAQRIFSSQIAQWDADLSGLKQRYTGLKTQLAVPDISPEVIHKLEMLISDFPVWWSNLSSMTKKSICDLVFARVVVGTVPIGKSTHMYVIEIDMNEGLPKFQPPPPMLQSEMGIKAARFALEQLRNGRQIIRSEFMSASGSTDPEYTRRLFTACRDWLGLDNW